MQHTHKHKKVRARPYCNVGWLCGWLTVVYLKEHGAVAVADKLLGGLDGLPNSEHVHAVHLQACSESSISITHHAHTRRATRRATAGAKQSAQIQRSGLGAKGTLAWDDAASTGVVLWVGRRSVGGCAHAVLVVLAHENHGQVPELGQVGSFPDLRTRNSTLCQPGSPL